MDENKKYVLFVGRNTNGKPCGISLIVKRNSILPIEGALIGLHDAVTIIFQSLNKDVHCVSYDVCTSEELGAMIFKNCMTPEDIIYYIY